jgi:hypothetical protein
MDLLEKHERKEHPLRPLIKHFKIELSTLANFCGVSYYHMSHLLCGRVTPSKRVKRLMDQVLKHLQKKMKEEKTND